MHLLLLAPAKLNTTPLRYFEIRHCECDWDLA